MGRGYIAVFGFLYKSNFACAVINVYAQCNLADKVVMWEEMMIVKDTQPCLCGDFNALRHADERKGTSIKGNQKKEISRFNSFIERNFLVELHVVGKKYTWFKADG